MGRLGDAAGERLSYVLVPSAFGELSVVWRETEDGPRVFRVFLPDAQTSARDLVQDAFPGATPRSSRVIAQLAERMGRFLEGDAVDFDPAILALEPCSDFQTRVLLAEHGIPRGWVSTYGEIARHLGVPGGARAVGGALARNPFPIVIPCHRTIRADGQLGGFQGGLAMKRALLELEGLGVSPAGVVLTGEQSIAPTGLVCRKRPSCRENGPTSGHAGDRPEPRFFVEDTESLK